MVLHTMVVENQVMPNGKKQLKKKLKTQKGVAAVMPILGKEEKSNSALIAALTPAQPSALASALPPAQASAPAVVPATVIAPTTATTLAFPATTTKLTGFLRNMIRKP